MISYIIMLFSLILENGWSLIFYKPDSLFLSCFSLVTLFSIYPLFNGDNKKYFISCFIYGLIYSIVLTNTLYLNAFIFLLIAFFISKAYKLFSMNIFNSVIVSIGIIIIYRIVNYLILIISGIREFNYISLLTSIYSSLLVNVFYILILRVIVSDICKRLGIKKAKY